MYDDIRCLLQAGPLVYAMTNEKTSKDLKMIQDAYLKRWKDLKYEQDVVRYQKEMASAERMVQTCNKDPSLPVCSPHGSNDRCACSCATCMR